jgi:hypothetical protein
MKTAETFSKISKANYDSSDRSALYLSRGTRIEHEENEKALQIGV